MNWSAELQLRQVRRAQDTLIAPGWSPALQSCASWSPCLRRSQRRRSRSPHYLSGAGKMPVSVYRGAAVLGRSDFGTLECVGYAEGRVTLQRFCARGGRTPLDPYIGAEPVGSTVSVLPPAATRSKSVLGCSGLAGASHFLSSRGATA